MMAIQNMVDCEGFLRRFREKYMKFSLEGGKCVILDTAQAQRESPHILNLHAITFDRSKELR